MVGCYSPLPKKSTINYHFRGVSLYKKLLRIALLPVGLVIRVFELAKDGSRDIENKLRFKNSIIDKGCCIDGKSKLEKCSHILGNTYILNSNINSYTYVGRNSLVQNTTIGSFCSIANDVFLGLGAHPTEYFSTSPLFYRIHNTFKIKLVDKNSDFKEYKPIIIGHDVWIGARAIVLDGVQVGNGAIIAANAVVTKDVAPYSIVGGVPAKVISYRFSPNKIERLINLQWWLWPLSEIIKRKNELEIN